MSGVGSLMLLDTASLYYRAFFGVPETVRAPDGTPVNAIRGLLDMISRLVRARHPARLVACLDADWRPAFREAAVSAKYGIPGRGYADFAALRGDPSDGLPGVPGVGEKTAAALIRTFGSIEGITTALDAGHGGFPRGSRDKLEKAREYLDVALSVVKVADDAPLPDLDGTLPAVPADADRLRELGDRWGLGSSLSRFVTAVSPS